MELPEYYEGIDQVDTSLQDMNGNFLPVAKKINYSYLPLCYVQSFIGMCNAFVMTSVIKGETSRLFGWLHGALENHGWWLYQVLRVALLCTWLIFEVTQLRLMVFILKKVGASIMAISIYTCHFVNGNLFSYVNEGKFPNFYQFVGMLFMISGVFHLCGLGVFRMGIAIRKRTMEGAKEGVDTQLRECSFENIY
jgi:hypothetical protein